ncbi:MAG: hypothetical protein ACTSQE_07320 [Candidatus Heimdallarchaeaceae archaeon]
MNKLNLSMDKMLSSMGLKYDDLSSDEKETYYQMLEVSEKKALSSEEMKNYIQVMIRSVEAELVDTKEKSRKSIFLKARLKNYILLESFLLGPDRAKKSLEKYVGTLKTV